MLDQSLIEKNFGRKKICSKKICQKILIQKNLVLKKFWSEKKFVQRKIMVQRNFDKKKNWFKKCLVQKMFGPKKVGSKIYFLPYGKRLQHQRSCQKLGVEKLCKQWPMTFPTMLQASSIYKNCKWKLSAASGNYSGSGRVG